MKYQLVLQFPGDSPDSYDELIGLENILIKELSDTADVDGHDFGSGEMNIFIYTDEPKPTFEKIKQILANQKSFLGLMAAYRQMTEENYTVIWPVGFDKPFKIA
jgi:hypothetical protein